MACKQKDVTGLTAKASVRGYGRTEGQPSRRMLACLLLSRKSQVRERKGKEGCISAGFLCRPILSGGLFWLGCSSKTPRHPPPPSPNTSFWQYSSLFVVQGEHEDICPAEAQSWGMPHREAEHCFSGPPHQVWHGRDWALYAVFFMKCQS